MLPLGRQASVAGFDSPAITHFTYFPFARINHGLDSEDHAGPELIERARPAVMQNLWFFVEDLADAVTAEFAHDGETCFFGVLLNHMPDVAKMSASAYF